LRWVLVSDDRDGPAAAIDHVAGAAVRVAGIHEGPGWLPH